MKSVLRTKLFTGKINKGLLASVINKGLLKLARLINRRFSSYQGKIHMFFP